MRFSWSSLILAPLLVPVIFSITMTILVTRGSLPAFLTMLAVSCVLSYGATIFLFLPSLFLFSLTHRMTGLKAALLGLVLGEVVMLPLIVFAWSSSGPDSGSPIENFLVFFLRWIADPVTAVFPLAGLITAALYWWLATRKTGEPVPAQ